MQPWCGSITTCMSFLLLPIVFGFQSWVHLGEQDICWSQILFPAIIQTLIKKSRVNQSDANVITASLYSQYQVSAA